MNAVESLSIDSESTITPEVDRGTPSVLVVDDSSLFRRMAGGLIRDGLGCRVACAADGIEALSLLESVEPSVVLTDIQMPRMDGFELVQAIRTDHPGIPVILMTAYGSEAVAARALHAGAASYIPKDCLASDLIDTLRRVLTVVEGNQRRRLLLACQKARTGSFEIGNDPDLFPALIGLVQEDLLTFSLGDATTRTRIAIAIQEALANALYHGNLECSSDLRQEDERHFYRLADERQAIEPYHSRRIHLETRIDRDEFRIDIRDEGPGFDVSSLDKPFDPEDLLRIGGRGMILIRSFLDQVIHNEMGNQITLIKRK
jgi:CheY-like chemotaxis protein/anti-sigma regulatory factor (Ser/Thr protein kinase)